MKRIADFCGKFGLPVWIHHNLAPISRGNSDTGRRYIAELRDLYKSCPQTKFIHCHAGVSRRIIVNDLVAIHDELLSNYPNVTLDLSWVVFEQEIILANRFDVDGDPMIKPAWIELIEKYPDRFMIGSDKVGSFADYRSEIRKWDALLKRLQPKTREMIAQTNFLQIMPPDGLTLPDGYYYPEENFVPLRDDPSTPRTFRD
jgi:predicted TIM-barrel fold metal-dependent hydrolase